MVVRAKFKLVGVKKFTADQWDDYTGTSHPMEMADLEFNAVGPKKDHNGKPQEFDENTAFWRSTPAGQIKVSTVNKVAIDELLDHLGGEFYVDFTWVEGTKPAGVVSRSVEERAW